jgi:HK97 family phage prohead protease
MKNRKYDFAGYVTKNDVECTDGLTIKQGAFLGDNEKQVPLVFQHMHDSPENVLGNVVLENRQDGVYGYGTFNNTQLGQTSKELVRHGDVNSMSIFAQQVKKTGLDVVHGVIKEVSLVLAGANPGAKIDFVNFAHSDQGENSDAEITFGSIIHSAEMAAEILGENIQNEDKVEHAAAPRTLGEIFAGMTPDEQEATGMLVEAALAQQINPDESIAQSALEDKENMKTNVFEQRDTGETLSHAAIVNERTTLIADATARGSLKEAIAHATEPMHGEKLALMFPDAQYGTKAPIHVGLLNTAAEKIISGVSKVPFSRVKNLMAHWDIEEARALGYITGDEKKQIEFKMLSRETYPQTVYIKSKYDRDDVIDITEYDLINYTSQNMMIKLKEEVARAILIGDGRAKSGNRSKIDETKIRPIMYDDDVYTVKSSIGSPHDVLERVTKDRAAYRGSGSPSLYIQPDLLADIKLLKDATGRYMFGGRPLTNEELASILGVKEIVETTFFGDLRKMIMVNLADYVVGSTKGGEITSFSDFDIDFNKLTNLIETRLSGALIQPKSAFVWTVGDAIKDTIAVDIASSTPIPTIAMGNKDTETGK